MMIKRTLEQIFEALKNEKIALCEDNTITAVALKSLHHIGSNVRTERFEDYILLKSI